MEQVSFEENSDNLELTLNGIANALNINVPQTLSDRYAKLGQCPLIFRDQYCICSIHLNLPSFTTVEPDVTYHAPLCLAPVLALIGGNCDAAPLWLVEKFRIYLFQDPYVFSSCPNAPGCFSDVEWNSPCFRNFTKNFRYFLSLFFILM